MKLTINSSELTKALEQAAKFVSAKPLMPILGNLKLATTEDCLFVTAFDLSHGIETSCNADVIKDGSVCIPVSAIAIIKSMTGQLIIETNETNLITISNLSGKVEIQGMPVDEYPELISGDFNPNKIYRIDAKSFTQAVKYCTQAASTDESKQVLTGVNIASDGGKLRLIATDGHRLAICNIALGDDGDILDSVTIPSKSLSLINAGKSDDIAISIHNYQASIDTGSRSIMPTLKGKYPDAMLLVPKSFARTMEIDRRELIDALNMMMAISDANNLVKFTIDSHAEISSASDGKSGKVNIDCQLTGGAIDIGFNLKYLLDGLKMFDSKQVKLSTNDPLQPVIITSDVESDVNLLYLLMPVQIRS